MEQITPENMDETSITLVSKVDIPATYCPKCKLLLPEGAGEKQCISCV